MAPQVGVSAGSCRSAAAETICKAAVLPFQWTVQLPSVPDLFLLRDQQCGVESAVSLGRGAHCQRVCAALLPAPCRTSISPVVFPASAASCNRRPAISESGFSGSAITNPTGDVRSASSTAQSRSVSVPGRITCNRSPTPSGRPRSIGRCGAWAGSTQISGPECRAA